MREGLVPGLVAEVSHVVTEDMIARFEELGLAHPVYSTWTMIRHMEEASRKLILPFLDPDEEAVGHNATATHLAPTQVGERVRIVAVLERVEGRRIVCRTTAYNERTTVGEGSTIQIVMPRDRLRELFAAEGAR